MANHQNILITGATGCGKSFLACALAHAAVRQGHTALYVRTPRLLDDLAVSRGDGRYQRLLAQLQRTSLLVLDDFLLTPAGVEQCRDLLEVVEDRAQLRSTLAAGQLPIDAWHGAMADPTLAEAILDRVLQQAHRITVKGPSMRARDPDGAAAPGPVIGRSRLAAGSYQQVTRQHGHGRARANGRLCLRRRGLGKAPARGQAANAYKPRDVLPQACPQALDNPFRVAHTSPNPTTNMLAQGGDGRLR